MVTSSLLFLFLIELVGASVFPLKSFHEPGKLDYTSSLNDSDTESGQERTVIAGTLVAGTVLVSLWSSVYKDKGIEIDISNRLTTSLNDPTWYMLHGQVDMLPPFLIKEKEESTKIMFKRVPNAGFGTEGVVCYQIGPQVTKDTLNLVIMWKMPQVFSSTGFFIKVIKGGHIPGENLKTMFKDVDDKKLWFQVEKQHHWQTKKEEGLTWKAAMGTRDLTSLKVVIVN